MKKLFLVLGICTLLICSTLTIMVRASDPLPAVRLPTEFVTMRAENGTTSWFVMTFSNIPVGYDIINRTYPGWCVNSSTIMTRGVDHTVRLYSSYDPALPWPFQCNNWSKINYVINHEQGASKNIIQEVIWFYISDGEIPENDTIAMNIINDTDFPGHGDVFIPAPGQKIAICAEMLLSDVNPIQPTFFELTLPPEVPIGDLVWRDDNYNGIQDSGEPGLPGITVDLYTPNGTEPVDSVITNVQGYYSFSPSDGSYYIKFNLPSGYKFSPANQGNDYTKDSDANPDNGKTIISIFNITEYNTSWDAGMYKVDEQGNPEPPIPPNPHAPTADGTAGEPYIAHIGEELLFNGSRSYDRDGTIVSWLWSFGDGTTANGKIVTHVYTTAGTFQVFLTVTDNDGLSDMFQTVALIRGPNQPPLRPSLSGPIEGRRSVTYAFNVNTTDPDDDNVQYIIQWGDNSQNTSPFYRSGRNVQLMHQWATWGFYTIQVYAQDPSNKTSEVKEKVIAIDVRYVGNLGYLINTDSAGPYDVFYSNSTGKQTSTQRQQNGIYLIDTNGDGKYNYQYDPALNEVKPYSNAPINPEYTMLIAGLIVVILLLILVWFIVRRKKNRT